MAPDNLSSRDRSWYQSRWEELMDLLPAADPDEIVDRVRELQVRVLDREADTLEEMGLTEADEAKTVLRRIFDRLQKLRHDNRILDRIQEAVGADTPADALDAIEALQQRVEALEQQQAILADAGFDEPEYALKAINSMEQQLDELYGEKKATVRSASAGDGMDGDTFDQLKALMAREEKLQRELGVSSPDEVIEMVEGLTDQLEDLYRDRDADTASDGLFGPSDAPAGTQTLKEELGVSDPEAVIAMVNNLTEQLDVLYSGRKSLSDLNLMETGEAVEMVRSLQHQLESIYEQREQMSDHGVENMDQALSMIDSMESQLSELYDERQRLVREGVDHPDDVSSQLDAPQPPSPSVSPSPPSEQSAPQGTDEQPTPEQAAAPSASPLLPEDTLSRLDGLSQNELDALSVGVFCVDDQGIVRRANTRALDWPDVTADDPGALLDAPFFEEIAPGANNALFRERVEAGLSEGAKEEHFVYTYVSIHASPVNLHLHVYSAPEASTRWILFQRA